MNCPARCSHPNWHQTPIDRDSLIAAGVTGDWISNARMCGHCGCVYSRTWDRLGRRHENWLQGYFRGELIAGGRWLPFEGDIPVVTYD